MIWMFIVGTIIFSIHAATLTLYFLMEAESDKYDEEKMRKFLLWGAPLVAGSIILLEKLFKNMEKSE